MRGWTTKELDDDSIVDEAIYSFEDFSIRKMNDGDTVRVVTGDYTWDFMPIVGYTVLVWDDHTGEWTPVRKGSRRLLATGKAYVTRQERLDEYTGKWQLVGMGKEAVA